MEAKNKTQFYGNKHRFVDGTTGYACKIDLDSVATGVNIARFRTELHLTREEFVYRLWIHGYLRISVQTLWKWETGKVKMGVGQLEALRQFFDKCLERGCSHDELVVYQTREIGDDRDQPVPFIITYCSFRRTFANANVRLFYWLGKPPAMPVEVPRKKALASSIERSELLTR